jgi:hypothetical protein
MTKPNSLKISFQSKEFDLWRDEINRWRNAGKDWDWIKSRPVRLIDNLIDNGIFPELSSQGLARLTGFVMLVEEYKNEINERN